MFTGGDGNVNGHNTNSPSIEERVREWQTARYGDEMAKCGDRDGIQRDERAARDGT